MQWRCFSLDSLWVAGFSLLFFYFQLLDNYFILVFNIMDISDKEKNLIKKFLRNIHLFKHFSDDHIDQVVDDFKIVSVKKGADIVFRADEGTDLFIVLKGTAKVSLLSLEGQEFVLTNFKKGDFFGEMSLIDGKSRSANVVAEEDTWLGILNREKFMSTMKQHPIIAFDLLNSLVERLRKADDMIETLAFLDVHERLVKFLVQSSKSDGEVDENGFYRTRKRTHMDIASNIGASRESVTKALKVLSVKQAVTERDGYFLVSPDAYDEPEEM
jgi:CRP-like cAMP-binding protein